MEEIQEEIKDAEVNPAESCAKEINAILEKYGMALGVQPPMPILIPKEKEVKSPVVQG